MKKIKLELTVEQVNFILSKLSKCPFEEVSIIISDIINQANKKEDE